MHRITAGFLLFLTAPLGHVSAQELRDRDWAALRERVAPAYRQGQASVVLKELSPLFNRWTDAETTAADRLLGQLSLPPAAELLIEARVQLARAGKEPVRAPLRESLAVADRLQQRLRLRKDQRAGHPALQTPPLAPADFVSYRRYLQDLYYLQQQLVEAQQLALLLEDTLIPLRGRRAQARLDDRQRKLVEREFVKEAEQFAAWARELDERTLELRVERLMDAESVIRLSGDTKERFLAAYALDVDGPEVLKALESLDRRTLASPLLSAEDLPARISEALDRSQDHLGDLPAKARLLEEAIAWWLRGRYGIGPRGNGLVKFAGPHAQLALFMPVAPVHLASPDDQGQTSATWEPQYERRHNYIWQGENREIYHVEGSASAGATDLDIDKELKLERQVVL